jgi:hypothetical protein
MLFEKDQIPISGDFYMKGNRADYPGNAPSDPEIHRFIPQLE